MPSALSSWRFTPQALRQSVAGSRGRGAPMDDLLQRAGLDQGRVERIVGDALNGADDGELFLEYRLSESLALGDGRLKAAGFAQTRGFGLPAVADDRTAYAHASDLDEGAIRRA